MERKKIYVFYPSKKTGGAEYLFKRASEIISKRHDLFIIDFNDGWIKKNLEKSKTQFSPIEFEPGIRIKIPDDALLITASSYLRNIDLFLSGEEARIMLWTLQPYNVIPVLPIFKAYQRKGQWFWHLAKTTILRNEVLITKRLLISAIKQKSLYAMDGESNTILNKMLELNYPGYLPVVVDDSTFTHSPPPPPLNAGTYNVTWLGRLDGEFKSQILKRVILDLNDYAKNKKNTITLKIIGDGPERHKLYWLSKKTTNIKVIFLGEQTSGDLNIALADSDLSFSMGTSAIETSARHIPTILLDFSYSAIKKGYKYQWIFDSEKHTLGRNISRFRAISCNNPLSMSDVFNSLAADQNGDIAKKCYEYAKDNHSVTVLEKKLFKAIQSSGLSFNQLASCEISKKPFWRKSN